MDWYTYDGTGSPNDLLNYFFTPFPTCPLPKIYLCAIRAETQLINGVDRPIITPDLQAEIAAARLTKVESANVRLRPTVTP